MFSLFLFLAYKYGNTGDTAYREWAGLAFVSLCTALGIQRGVTTSEPAAGTTINTDTIKTGDVLLPDQSNLNQEKTGEN